VSAQAGTMFVNTAHMGYNLIRPDGMKETFPPKQVLEPHILRTTGIWLDLPKRTPAGAVHALEHLLKIVVPLFIMSERSDIDAHIDGQRIYLYDNFQGGVGLAESALPIINDILERCYEMVTTCECHDGCPSCLHIGQCMSRNNNLDKEGVIKMLAQVSIFHHKNCLKNIFSSRYCWACGFKIVKNCKNSDLKKLPWKWIPLTKIYCFANL